MTSRKPKRIPKAGSAGEELFSLHCRVNGLEPEREFIFSKRRYRFDFAFPEQKLAVEIEGGIWVNGRHNRASSIEADFEKYALAAILGWRVIRVSTWQVNSGLAIDWTIKALL